MKKVGKIILNIILVFIITLLMFGTFSIFTVTGTILNKNYMISLLEEKDYYSNIKTDLENKFEEYEYQSGLPEEIFDNLCTHDMVKNDINSIISNIYEQTEVTNSSDQVKENLENNINKYLADNNIVLNQVEQDNIDEFEKLVIKAYEENIDVSEEIVSQIHSIESKTSNILAFVKIALAVALIIMIIILFVANIQDKWNFVNQFMICLLSTGALLKAGVSVIEKNMDIENIVFMTQLLSNLIKEVFFDLLANIQIYGIAFIIIGVLGIIASNYKRADNDWE